MSESSLIYLDDLPRKDNSRNITTREDSKRARAQTFQNYASYLFDCINYLMMIGYLALALAVSLE